MNQQQQNHCFRRNKVGPEPSSTSILLLFSVQAAKSVMILCECVGSSGHSLLAYAINQNSHELALKVWPEPSSTYIFGACESLATADNRCNQFGPRSGSTEKSLILKKKTAYAKTHEKLH